MSADPVIDELDRQADRVIALAEELRALRNDVKKERRQARDTARAAVVALLRCARRSHRSTFH